MLSEILAITKKEFIEVIREPATVLIVLIIFPLSTILLFGYALKFEVKNIDLAIFDGDSSDKSRQLVEEIKKEEDFAVVENIAEANVREKFDHGEIDAAIFVPEGYSEKLGKKEKIVLKIQVDGTEPLALKTLSEKVGGIVNEQNRSAASEALSAAGLEFETQAIEVEKEILFSPELRDQDFFIPGVIGIIVTTISMFLSCLAIVREKEMGTIEAIAAAPVGRLTFILGKMIPCAAIGLAGLGVTSALGIFWFKIPFAGSVLFFIATSFVFILSSLGLGLLFSVFVQNSLQAAFSVTVFLIISIILSGFIFPVSSMPIVVQRILLVFPLTYYMEIVRGILIKGVGYAVLSAETAALAAITVLTLLLSSLGLLRKLG